MVNRIAHKNLILLIVAVAQFMVVLDSSIVNVALPSMFRSLHFTSESSLQWVVTAYTLAVGGFLLLGGRTADLYGRKRVFTLAITAFSITSLICGLAQTDTIIQVSRAFQGLAAAFMSPAALSIVLTTFKEGQERTKALSVWAAISAGGAAMGLLLGGILTTYLDWRWNFFVNIPVGIGVVLMALKYVPESKADLDHNKLDVPGAVLVTSGLMVLVYAFTKAPQWGWADHRSIGFFLASIILLCLFVYNESRSKHALLPLSIFKIRNIAGANLTQLPIIASMFSMFFFVTLYVQTVLGFSPIKSGLSFLPIPLVIGGMSVIMQHVIGKIGYKKPLVVAPLLLATGLFMLAHIEVGGSYFTHVLPGLVIMAAGLGMTFISITIAATNGVPASASGLASGLLNTSQQIGGSLGLAILSGVSASSSLSYLASHGGRTASALVQAQARVTGFQHAFYTGMCFALLGSVFAALLIHERKGEKIAADPAALAGA